METNVWTLTNLYLQTACMYIFIFIAVMSTTLKLRAIHDWVIEKETDICELCSWIIWIKIKVF